MELRVSRDDGATWPERHVLADRPQSEARFFEPKVAASGNRIAVVWRAADPTDILGSYHRYAAYASVSADAGATWSEPATFHEAATDENVPELAVATDGTHVFAAYGITGAGIGYDYRRVCVVSLAP